MNMIQSAKDQIAALTRSAYRAAVQEGLLPDGVETVPAVEIPKDTANGDYTTTFCLAASKAMRKNPREVANILTQHMKLDGTYFTSVEIAGPGFLNFRLGEKWYADVVEDVEREADAYGRGEGLKGKKYMVEFVSANPTGPMHMGNARGGVLGDTLASVLDWSGANVRLGVTEEEAHRMIYQTDRYRADYYKYYTGGETWTNPVLYDMTLNSDRMGMDKCTELIIQYLKIKLGEDILDKKGTAENDKALKQLGLF